jgi:branched-chain amino acid transport system substrate-binding protein
MQADMLAEAAAKLGKKRWATIAPNYSYGKEAVADFEKLLKQRQPDVQFVAEQWPGLFKIDAGAEVQALAAAKPDAIFNVTFGPDLAKFVREGQTRGLFKDRLVVGLLTGEPEYLDPLKGEAPKGWLVTGYPWYAIDTPEHKAFLDAYQKKFHDYPRLGSVVGYSTMMTAAAALRKAGSTDTDALVKAMAGLTIDTPIGKVTYRAIDHQSTMGAFVGTLAVKDGKGIMVDWSYRDGANYQPSDAEVKKMRPADD